MVHRRHRRQGADRHRVKLVSAGQLLDVCSVRETHRLQIEGKVSIAISPEIPRLECDFVLLTRSEQISCYHNVRGNESASEQAADLRSVQRDLHWTSFDGEPSNFNSHVGGRSPVGTEKEAHGQSVG